MIELVAEGVIENTRNKKYIIDTASELSQLEAGFGNEAYCIADKTTYICDGTGSYVEKGDEGGGSSISTEPLSVTTNGTYRAPSGTAYSPVTVSVAPNLGAKSITANGTYTASSDNEDGYSSVTVNVTAVSKLPAVVDRSVTEITASDLVGVTKIGGYAFRDCALLETVEIPDGIIEIGEYGFYMPTVNKLTSVTIPSSVTKIQQFAFYYGQFSEISLPQGLTLIGNGAFKYCKKLEQIEIPRLITTINQEAFQFCSALSSVTLPSGLATIGSSAFAYSGLAAVDIPSTITSIGAQAFASCSSLASVTIRATTPPTLSNKNAFSNTVAIYVPSASVDTYKAASNWADHSSQIQAIPS